MTAFNCVCFRVAEAERFLIEKDEKGVLPSWTKINLCQVTLSCDIGAQLIVWQVLPGDPARPNEQTRQGRPAEKRQACLFIASRYSILEY